MKRLDEIPATTTAVQPPEALLDHLSPIWRSHRLTDRWWLRHLGDRAPVEVDTEWNTPSWATRYLDAAIAWAARVGISDFQDLAALGVIRPTPLERSAARAGADHCVHQ